MEKPPRLMARTEPLLDAFGTPLDSTKAEFRAALKPLFLWMHRHGVGLVEIHRQGTKAETNVSNSDWSTPLGQVIRTTSAPVASPSPKWTIGDAITCF